MNRNWTFGQKVGAGFAVIVVLTMVGGVISSYALRGVVTGKDRVITVDAQNLIDAQRLADAADRRVAAIRGYFLIKQEAYLSEIQEQRDVFGTVIAALRDRVRDSEGRRLLDEISRKEADYRTATDRIVAMRQRDASLDAIVASFDQDAAPRREVMAQAIDAFTIYGSRVMDRERDAASVTASAATNMIIVINVLVAVLAAGLALLLTRVLASQIGTAVGQVQSSSTELQAASNQQATGAKQQATAMSEISTTISELLATSRQIAESAQRVAQIAEQTARAARAGDGTVEKGNEAMTGIRRQVDLVVNHMLELGKKSQQIGSVLDIVAELAEQTNILAINATIEAAGAGESGKRFAVVAEEIRKLADRVGGSTKEIRGLIDDVRSAVNTTVMTTETGSKAVDSGAKQFAEVASSFRQIAGLVGTTTDAAKEIELSTKQQTTAVEQVNIAITNVAQASRETEASTGQTLQTASQLSGLARELLRLVQPQTVVQYDPHARMG